MQKAELQIFKLEGSLLTLEQHVQHRQAPIRPRFPLRISEATGTKDGWKVESRFRERANREGDGDSRSKGYAFFTRVRIR